MTENRKPQYVHDPSLWNFNSKRSVGISNDVAPDAPGQLDDPGLWCFVLKKRKRKKSPYENNLYVVCKIDCYYKYFDDVVHIIQNK